MGANSQTANQYRPCPDCPDGQVWNNDGPTGRACKTCKGFATLNLDGSALEEPEMDEPRDQY